MKLKRILPLLLAVLTVCVLFTACGGGLSGTYKKVGSDSGLLLLAFSDELTFKGSEVTYALTFGKTTSEYEIDGDTITIYYSGVGMTADFRKEGKYIYIGEAKWEKF